MPENTALRDQKNYASRGTGSITELYRVGREFPVQRHREQLCCPTIENDDTVTYGDGHNVWGRPSATVYNDYYVVWL